MNYKDFLLADGLLATGRKFSAVPPAYYVQPYRTAISSGVPTPSDANSGLDRYHPFKTTATALDLAVDHAGQVIFVISSATSAANTTDDLSATLTIDNNGIALIGVNSGSNLSQRSRFNQLSTATGVAPMVTISGSNNYFEDLQFFQGVNDATSVGNVQVTGDRNYFKNVHFAGIGHTAMDVADAYSLKVTGEENVFENCVIGIDTIGRGSAANSELLFASQATRNRFINCLFLTYADAATHQFLIAGASSMDRWALFENCKFINAVDSAATAMTEAFDTNASQGGTIILDNCSLYGATEWEAGDTGNILIVGPSGTAATSGISLEPAV